MVPLNRKQGPRQAPPPRRKNPKVTKELDINIQKAADMGPNKRFHSN